MTDRLTNQNEIQVVALKLDKNKAREFAFRMFLDQNDSNGINRKEAILRMFEYMYSNDLLDNSTFITKNSSKKDIKQDNVESKSKIDVFNINETKSKVSKNDWDDV